MVRFLNGFLSGVVLVALFQNAAGQTSTQNQRSQGTNPGQASSSSQPAFGGTYEALNPQQKKLMDEWYADYNELTGDHASPTEYNQYSLSARTTYEAVTHALMTTQLTDQSGKPMGSGSGSGGCD